MEVTRANFKEVLPKVRKSIDNADFIVIDSEMTGLRSSNLHTPNGYDTPKEYYEKLYKASKDFIIIQYGLCMFRYDARSKSFKQEGYTFYISSTISNLLINYVPDRVFLCQSSSIDFLNQHNFDFNKMFKEGICYLNVEEQENYRKTLLEVQKTRKEQLQSSESANAKRMSIGAEDKEKVDKIFSVISEFLASDEQERVLPQCNRFIRKIIYTETPNKFSNKVILETRNVENSRDKLFVVTKWKGVDQRLNENAKKVEKENEDFENCIGFTKIIQHLVESQKLIIGHNIMLDLFHTIDKFLTKLSDDYEQFKETAHQLFPNIIDTKQMCSSSTFKDLIASSVLIHVMDSLRKEPFTIPTVEVEKDGLGYDLNNDKCHEAGYDAFLTGMCFLTMWNYLITQHKKSALDFNLLAPFKNRIFLLRLFDSAHTNLAGDDPEISKDHVFYLKFPKQWKQSDIVSLFQNISPISIAWINDESAYVGLYKREETARAWKLLCKPKNNTYQIMTYAKYRKQSPASSKTPIANKTVTSVNEVITTKRKISESSSENATDESDNEIVIANTVKVQSSEDNWISVPLKKPGLKKIKKVPFEESSDWN